MGDLVADLREQATMKVSEAWRRQDGGQDLCIGAALAEAAADEIERLREEVELWKDRCAAADQALEATIQDWDGSLQR